MGDRGNIVVIGDRSEVYLYTHWGGSDLPNVVKNGLILGKDRWDDPQYLGRILFASLTDGDNSLTGYGITSVEFDGGTTIKVNTDDQTVSWSEGDKPVSCPFSTYVKSK